MSAVLRMSKPDVICMNGDIRDSAAEKPIIQVSLFPVFLM